MAKKTTAAPQRGRPKAKLEHPMQTLRRVLQVVGKRYWPHLIVMVVCTLVSVLAMVQGTMFTKTLIDSYILPLVQTVQAGGTPDFSGLIQAITRVALFYGCGVLASFAQTRVMIYVTQGALRDLRDDLFQHMQRLPIRYFDTHAHGDIMSIYTNDIDTLRQMISQSLPQLLNCAITVVSVLVSMVLLSVPLTLLTLAMVALLLVATRKMAGLSGRYFVAQQRDLGSLNGFIEEMMEGQKVVKVFCHEEERKHRGVHPPQRGPLPELPERQHPGQYAHAPLGPDGQHQLCALRHGGGHSGPGEHRRLYPGRAGQLPHLQQELQHAHCPDQYAAQRRHHGSGRGRPGLPAAGRDPRDRRGRLTLVNVKEGADGQLIETDERTNLWAWKRPVRGDQPVAYRKVEGDVTFDDVDFGYTDEKMVLHHIKLFATPGQKIAFVGSTGAGKTTITNLINRFYDIQDGKIRYDGVNINRIKKDDLRRSLGIVLQDTNLFTGTVMDNIRYGRLDARDEECIAAAQLANADGFIRRLPQGYDTWLTGNGANLSQGQRQLLAIARAAVADPPVLILDEATSSIDTRTEMLVQQGMDGLMYGRTTFVIAHRLSTVRNADCIMVLEQGRIIERGSHEELMEKKGRYYQLYTGSAPT